MMSLFGGAVAGIASVICNSVALTPRVPAWSRCEAVDTGRRCSSTSSASSFLDPRVRRRPAAHPRLDARPPWSLAHRECDVRACHMLSFMWGSGHPAMYEHGNLLPGHPRANGRTCAAPSGLNYQRHVRKMVKAGHAVKYDPGDRRHRDLPDNYLAQRRELSTPILFLTGDRNHVFADSNIVCHRLLARRSRRACHELEIIPGLRPSRSDRRQGCPRRRVPADCSSS